MESLWAPRQFTTILDLAEYISRLEPWVMYFFRYFFILPLRNLRYLLYKFIGELQVHFLPPFTFHFCLRPLVIREASRCELFLQMLM